MWSADELIVAAATVPGAGGRAIVRIAGHGLDAVLRRMFEASAAGFPAPGERPRAVSVTSIRSAAGSSEPSVRRTRGAGGDASPIPPASAAAAFRFGIACSAEPVAAGPAGSAASAGGPAWSATRLPACAPAGSGGRGNSHVWSTWLARMIASEMTKNWMVRRSTEACLLRKGGMWETTDAQRPWLRRSPRKLSRSAMP